MVMTMTMAVTMAMAFAVAVVVAVRVIMIAMWTIERRRGSSGTMLILARYGNMCSGDGTLK